MRSLLRILLLAALCCSAPLLNAGDIPPTRLKYGAWGFDLSGMDPATDRGTISSVTRTEPGSTKADSSGQARVLAPARNDRSDRTAAARDDGIARREIE